MKEVFDKAKIKLEGQKRDRKNLASHSEHGFESLKIIVRLNNIRRMFLETDTNATNDFANLKRLNSDNRINVNEGRNPGDNR